MLAILAIPFLLGIKPVTFHPRKYPWKYWH
jgi:hypothetical protein